MFNQYGLDIPSAMRAMITIAARTKRMPFVIGAVPSVSLDGDAFPNATAYAKQIPGYWESIVKAHNEPVEEGVVYDPKTFWDSI
ncbi:MAG: hypothetical protein FWG05_04970 [Kiritimatiellaeota bacterium]|nr:hypothetical protein [Kiritimatiellota bacterium]